MLLHKKVISPACPLHEKAPQYSADKASAVKNSINNNQHIKSSTSSSTPDETTRNEQPKLSDLMSTIRELPCQPQTGSTSRDDTSTAVQGKGKKIVSSFCIFEPGQGLLFLDLIDLLMYRSFPYSAKSSDPQYEPIGSQLLNLSQRSITKRQDTSLAVEHQHPDVEFRLATFQTKLLMK